ncbi:hypothetical protein J1N35_005359 [Gossypium stocksii]|uniref:Uncharacterized protein n=1 Tax=Gossypium stocksii TaxID=47602 RepID=A0A9D3WDN1_9ROSI|nr:hypothetical protein J1N35_005359 [Gossypium stocksii]
MIYGGWIKMTWIRRNFTELVEDSIKVQRERYVRMYILQIIGGASKLSWGSAVFVTFYRRCVRRRNQRTSKLVEPYAESHKITYRASRYNVSIRPTIGSGLISDEFFVNIKAWHFNVPLVVYATIEMHKTNRVSQQFRFQQSIPVAP